ncbi:MAG: glycosyltransferase family 1 protein [Caldilinea sp. CFX5]|nr:glycosyltransferase family 1 protein [Caldilinea sp. CFX5]
MNISFILSSLWLSGGVRVIAEFANRLTERGHHITLVVPSGTIAPEMLIYLDQRVTIVESRVGRQTQMSSLQNLRLLLSLAYAVPRSDILIATHTPTTLVSLLAGHLLGKGRLLWLFQDYPEMFAQRPFESWLMRYALRWHRMALTVSTYCQRELQQHAPGRVTVVGEGLSDAELFQPVPLADRPPDARLTIFFLGDMRPRKGLADFLAAADLVYHKMPGIKLWLASKEHTQVTCQAPYKQFHLPSRTQLVELYSTCGLFVSASWGEGFGLPPLEAMACGTPVILTNSGGVQEYAEPGVNCLMVPPRQPALMAAAILELLNNRELAERLAENGAITAQRYQWPAVVDRFELALQEIMQ